MEKKVDQWISAAYTKAYIQEWWVDNQCLYYLGTGKK